MSVNTSYGIRLYQSCLSFVRNLLERVGLDISRIPFWVVASTVRSAVLTLIPQFLASCLAVMGLLALFVLTTFIAVKLLGTVTVWLKANPI